MSDVLDLNIQFLKQLALTLETMKLVKDSHISNEWGINEHVLCMCKTAYLEDALVDYAKEWYPINLKDTDIPEEALKILEQHSIETKEELDQCTPQALLSYFRNDHDAYSKLKNWREREEVCGMLHELHNRVMEILTNKELSDG